MRTICLLIFISIFNISLIHAQTIDDSFQEPLPVRPAKILCMKMLSDTTMLLGGDIAFFNNERVNNLIKLKSDSTIDKTFDFKGDNALLIRKIEIQNSGNIIVLAQEYLTLTNVVFNNYSLFQINSNGDILHQIDTLKHLNSCAVQKDDKVLVGGGVYGSEGYLYRLNDDFSLDQTFNQDISFNNMVCDVVADSNSLFVSGIFSYVNDTLNNDVVKLKLSGYIDTTFNTGSGTNDQIGALTLQDDGKILLGKTSLNSFNGISCNGMGRLNPDGSLDTDFTPPRLNGMLWDVFLKGTSIFIATTLNPHGSSLIKLRPNGIIDTDFNLIQLDDSGFRDFSMEFDKENLIVSNSSASGNKFGLSKYDSAGNHEDEFTPEVGRYGVISLGDYHNDKLLIAGDFIQVNGVETYGIAQLKEDGSVDSSFVLSNNYGNVIQLDVIDNDSILVSTGKNFFKLDSTGQLHSGFEYEPFKSLYQVIKFNSLDDGRIMVGDYNNIYRLNVNGTEDTTFNIGTGISGGSVSAFDFDMQGDQVIYGSFFTEFNGTDVNRLIRLNPDASVDDTFDIGSGPDDGVYMIKVLDNNDILVGGYFNSFNGRHIPHGFLKLSENGSIDSTFLANRENSNYIQLNNSKVEQVDSLIIIKYLNNITVLNVDGQTDNSFTIPFTINKLNNIIVVNDSSKVSGEKKSASIADGEPFLFALGSFQRNDKDEPSFLIKMAVNTTSTSSYTPSMSQDEAFPYVKVYPNPAQNYINVHFTNSRYPNSYIHIYDILGNLQKSQKLGPDHSVIDVSRLRAGMYILKIASGRKILKTGRIIIE